MISGEILVSFRTSSGDRVLSKIASNERSLRSERFLKPAPRAPRGIKHPINHENPLRRASVVVAQELRDSRTGCAGIGAASGIPHDQAAIVVPSGFGIYLAEIDPGICVKAFPTTHLTDNSMGSATRRERRVHTP